MSCFVYVPYVVCALQTTIARKTFACQADWREVFSLLLWIPMPEKPASRNQLRYTRSLKYIWKPGQIVFISWAGSLREGNLLDKIFLW